MDQQDLFDPDVVRSLLDQLLADARLYKSGKDYKELLDFVVRLPNFAPFNAMLLQVQKPGLRFAASARATFVRPVTASKSRACREGHTSGSCRWLFSAAEHNNRGQTNDEAPAFAKATAWQANDE